MDAKKGKERDYSRLTAVGRGLVIGLFVGVVISLFRLLIMKGLLFVQWFFGQAHHHVWLLGVWVLISLVLTIVVGRLIKQTPEIKGSGIPQVEGQLMGELDYHWWPVLWKKFVGGVLAIGSGLFLGREGPSIQLGATVGQGVAAVTHNTGSQRRLMIASGASAGLSAAFNAPIASTLFILEEVYHNFSTLIWLSALASALTANFVSTAVFGLTPVLHINYFASLPLSQYGLLLVLGLVLGLLGRLYQSDHCVTFVDAGCLVFTKCSWRRQRVDRFPWHAYPKRADPFRPLCVAICVFNDCVWHGSARWHLFAYLNVRRCFRRVFW